MTHTSPVPLSALGEVALSPENQRRLDAAAATSGGPPLWRARKLAEARDLLALSQIAGRLTVQALDLDEALRVLLHLRVPVPCLDAQRRFEAAPLAVLGLTYRQEALRQQLPGYAFVQVLLPQNPWHANIAMDRGRPLCLGTQLPAGIRCKELVLMAYGALSMQTVQIDEMDVAGVLNVEAARWWQQNTHRIPLTRTPFLAAEGSLPGERGV
jgi:hypothetical protein